MKHVPDNSITQFLTWFSRFMRYFLSHAVLKYYSNKNNCLYVYFKFLNIVDTFGIFQNVLKKFSLDRKLNARTILCQASRTEDQIKYVIMVAMINTTPPTLIVRTSSVYAGIIRSFWVRSSRIKSFELLS